MKIPGAEGRLRLAISLLVWLGVFWEGFTFPVPVISSPCWSSTNETNLWEAEYISVKALETAVRYVNPSLLRKLTDPASRLSPDTLWELLRHRVQALRIRPVAVLQQRNEAFVAASHADQLMRTALPAACGALISRESSLRVSVVEKGSLRFLTNDHCLSSEALSRPSENQCNRKGNPHPIIGQQLLVEWSCVLQPGVLRLPANGSKHTVCSMAAAHHNRCGSLRRAFLQYPWRRAVTEALNGALEGEAREKGPRVWVQTVFFDYPELKITPIRLTSGTATLSVYGLTPVSVIGLHSLPQPSITHLGHGATSKYHTVNIARLPLAQHFLVSLRSHFPRIACEEWSADADRRGNAISVTCSFSQGVGDFYRQLTTPRVAQEIEQSMEAWLSLSATGAFWCSFAPTFMSEEPRLTFYDVPYSSSIKIRNVNPKAFMAAYGPYVSAAMSDLAEALATVLAISRSRVRIRALHLGDRGPDGDSADEISWRYELLPDPFLREITARDAFLLVSSSRLVQNQLQEFYVHQVLRYRWTTPRQLYPPAVFQASLAFPRPTLADYLAPRDDGHWRVHISGVRITLFASPRLRPVTFVETLGTTAQLCAFLRTSIAKTLRVWPHRVEVESVSDADLARAGGWATLWGGPLVELTLLAPDEVSRDTPDEERTLLDVRRELLPSLYSPESSINSNLETVLKNKSLKSLPFPLLGAPAGKETFTVQELVAIGRRLGGKVSSDPLQPQDVDEMLSFFEDRLITCAAVFRVSLQNGPRDGGLSVVENVVRSTLSRLLGLPDEHLSGQTSRNLASTAGDAAEGHIYDITITIRGGSQALSRVLRRLALMTKETEEEVDENLRVLLPSTGRILSLRSVAEVVSPLVDLIDGLSLTVAVSGVGHPQNASLKKFYFFDFAVVVAHHLNRLLSGETDSQFECRLLRLKDPLGRATIFRCEDVQRIPRFFPVTLPRDKIRRPHPAALQFERDVCKWVRQVFSSSACVTSIHLSVRFEQLKYSSFDSHTATWIQVTGVGYDEIQEAYSRDALLVLTDLQHAVAQALSPSVSRERVVVSKILPVSQAAHEAPAITFRIFLLPDALLSSTSAAEAAFLLRSKASVQQVLREEYLDKKLAPRLQALRHERPVTGASSLSLIHAESVRVEDDLDRVEEDVVIWRLSVTKISVRFGTTAHFGQYVRAALAAALNASFDRFEVIKVFERRGFSLENVKWPWARLESVPRGLSSVVVRVAIRSPDDTGDVLEEFQHPRLLQLLLERKLRRRTDKRPATDMLNSGLQLAFGEKRLRVSARPSSGGWLRYAPPGEKKYTSS